mmetsp:Transcript_62210/g.178972  ORF Transcript_62210/g.178972 Transcript_62210/m.178972 type:complete len:246 (+) Transcript_62210:81-818(+)
MGAGCCSEVSKAGPPSSFAPTHHGHQRSSASHSAAPAPALPPAAAGPSSTAGASPQTGARGAPSPGSSAGGRGSDEDRFVSKVGDLPSFDKPKQRGGGADFDDAASERSQGTHISGVSDMVDNMHSKEQKQHAKAVVKDFVKAMVKGRKLNVMAPSGSLRSCTVSISRNLDALRIKADSKTQNIPLKTVEEIHAGTDVEGIETPLDELCATLMLTTENCITFRLNDINDRDTFVMCLLMFCNNQK